MKDAHKGRVRTDGALCPSLYFIICQQAMLQAVATFMEEFIPAMGIWMVLSDRFSKSWEMPDFSDPKIKRIFSFLEIDNFLMSILEVVISRLSIVYPSDLSLITRSTGLCS